MDLSTAIPIERVAQFDAWFSSHSADTDRAVIVVTHDSRVYDFGDRIVHMSDGRIERVEERS